MRGRVSPYRSVDGFSVARSASTQLQSGEYRLFVCNANPRATNQGNVGQRAASPTDAAPARFCLLPTTAFIMLPPLTAPHGGYLTRSQRVQVS